MGVQVPASALQPNSDTDNVIRRPSTPIRAPSDLSYISFDDDVSPPSWTKRVRTAVNNAKDKEKDRERGMSFWDGALNGKKSSLPARDQSFGSRDGTEGSFMDLRDTKKAGQIQRSSSIKGTSKLEKVSIDSPEVDQADSEGAW